jgi:hypothetical protein
MGKEEAYVMEVQKVETQRVVGSNGRRSWVISFSVREDQRNLCYIWQPYRERILSIIYYRMSSRCYKGHEQEKKNYMEKIGDAVNNTSMFYCLMVTVLLAHILYLKNLEEKKKLKCVYFI